MKCDCFEALDSEVHVHTSNLNNFIPYFFLFFSFLIFETEGQRQNESKNLNIGYGRFYSNLALNTPHQLSYIRYPSQQIIAKEWEGIFCLYNHAYLVVIR